MLLSNFYGGEFYSKTAVSEYEPGIETLDDLYNSFNNDKYILKSIPYLEKYIRGAQEQFGESLFYQMQKFVNRTGQFETLIKLDDFSKLIATFPSNLIFITTPLHFEMLENRFGTKEFLISSESINTYINSIALAKKSPFLEPFNLM